jgi:hypothetical protein
MKHNKRKKSNQKGGKMKVLLGVIFMITQMSGVYALDIDNKGMMDEVVVIAPRFEGEDIAYSGMMSEVVAKAPRYYSEVELGMMDQVVVTAPRFEGEDIAYSGMMSEVVVTASRYEEDNIVFGYMVKLERNESNECYYLLLIEDRDYQERDYLN